MKCNLYDFDETIYYGDSSVDFFIFCLKKKKSMILMLPKMLLALIKYILKINDKTKMKEVFFSYLKKFDDIDKLVLEFWDKNEYKIKNFYKAKKHDKDIIISASPYFLLKPIADKLEVFDLIASDVDKKTGKFIGLNCHDKQKVKLLNEKYKDIEVMESYSDSLSDTPILNLAKDSYIVIDNKIVDFKKYKKESFIKMLYRKNREAINYVIVGILTTLVSLLSFYVSSVFLNTKNSIDLQIANVISWIIAVLFAYITNRIIVFKSKSKKVIKEFISFIISRIITLIIDMLSMHILVIMLNLNDIVSKVFVQFIIIILNYVFSKIIVFKKD